MGQQQQSQSEAHALPFARESNSAARRLLAAFLSDRALDPVLLQDAAIVMGELVANGLDHGRPDDQDCLEVSWRIDERELSLSVHDAGGPTVPTVLDVDQFAARGRGLAMVQKLSSSWSVDRSHGTQVTVVLPLA
jgi:anti-sigma regulatory factor (Ser/Thr protein kinase)